MPLLPLKGIHHDDGTDPLNQTPRLVNEFIDSAKGNQTPAADFTPKMKKVSLIGPYSTLPKSSHRNEHINPVPGKSSFAKNTKETLHQLDNNRQITALKKSNSK